MKRLSKIALVLLFVLSTVIVSVTAGAAGSVVYDGKAQDFVFAPGSEHSPTDPKRKRTRRKITDKMNQAGGKERLPPVFLNFFEKNVVFSEKRVKIVE